MARWLWLWFFRICLRGSLKIRNYYLCRGSCVCFNITIFSPDLHPLVICVANEPQFRLQRRNGGPLLRGIATPSLYRISRKSGGEGGDINRSFKICITDFCTVLQIIWSGGNACVCGCIFWLKNEALFVMFYFCNSELKDLLYDYSWEIDFKFQNLTCKIQEIQCIPYSLFQGIYITQKYKTIKMIVAWNFKWNSVLKSSFSFHNKSFSCWCKHKLSHKSLWHWHHMLLF